MKLVYVEWLDSYGVGSAWQPLDDLKEADEPFLCRSVGWLVIDGSHSIVIVPHIHFADESIGSGDQGCGDMMIPKASISKMVNIDLETKNETC